MNIPTRSSGSYVFVVLRRTARHLGSSKLKDLQDKILTKYAPHLRSVRSTENEKNEVIKTQMLLVVAISLNLCAIVELLLPGFAGPWPETRKP